MDINKKSELDELVNSDGGAISGDRNVTNDSEIETGPVQKPWNDDSEYEKGMSTTTDRATRYRQNIPWFAVYSYRSSSGRGLPINEKTNTNSASSSDFKSVKLVTKNQLEEEVMEDIVKKSKDREVWGKDYDTKTEKILDIIDDEQLSDNQLERIKKAVLNKLEKKK